MSLSTLGWKYVASSQSSRNCHSDPILCTRQRRSATDKHMQEIPSSSMLTYQHAKQVGFSEQCPDALTRRSACTALSQLARSGSRASEDQSQAAHRALTGSLFASGLPEEGWYSVAEAAVSALYALHPQPAQLCEAVLRSMAKSAMTAIQKGETCYQELLLWSHAGHRRLVMLRTMRHGLSEL